MEGVVLGEDFGEAAAADLVRDLEFRVQGSGFRI